MIRGYFGGVPGRRRPLVVGRVAIPTLSVVGTIHFLVDTGADSTVLSPTDVFTLGIDLSRLPAGPVSIGVGGRMRTVSATGSLTLGTLSFNTTLRILAPTGRTQRQALDGIPSLLGRDVLRNFALFLEERTDRVLLLMPDEADALDLS